MVVDAVLGELFSGDKFPASGKIAGYSRALAPIPNALASEKINTDAVSLWLDYFWIREVIREACRESGESNCTSKVGAHG